MEEVGQTTQLRAGELIIIVVVLIMWAGEDQAVQNQDQTGVIVPAAVPKCRRVHLCSQVLQSWLLIHSASPRRCNRSLLSPV